MSEQVQCMSAQDWAERAPTRRMVLQDDFDALHAEAEALRADIATIRADRDAFGQNAVDMRQRIEALRADNERMRPIVAATFKIGQRVRKKSGSEWQGRIVGTYSTALTPEGYAVESEAHAGSVQIYPVTALEAFE
jgi:hypothetical protein